jgi:hypothetical protein
MLAVLDIETERFTQRFQDAKGQARKVELAPKPKLACVYWPRRRRYEFFTGKNVADVVPALAKATCIVTFHGEWFDFLVLERWCGLQRTPRFLAKSFDLSRVVGANRFRFLAQPHRKGVNLDRTGKLNFGIPRKVAGTLREKCKAHVWLTYRCFEALREDELMVPVRPPKEMPTRCPECGAEADLVPFQPDYDQMTEGQIWDYEIAQQVGARVGGWGFARCTKKKCRKVFCWGI